MTEEEILNKLFQKWCGNKANSIQKLPLSGSNRAYYRIKHHDKTAIGVINQDKKENIAFLQFTHHFRSKNLQVPEIYAEDLENNCYIQQDLGDETLFSLLSKNRNNSEIGNETINYYKKVIDELVRFQVIGHQNFDYKYCYPRSSFDKQSMVWDLNYFKYYFLKLAQIPYDEQSLEDDFNTFSEYLSNVESDFFMYRDFQSRNIMIQHGKVWFIDYQGGRKGALQYDLASLLFDAKADLPNSVRETMLEYYLDALEPLYKVDRKKFRQHYYAFVLVRILQAMGAYGFRGFYEKKTHFLQSIPYALQNLKWILENAQWEISIPTLTDLLYKLTVSEKLLNIGSSPKKLTVYVNSFSFKKGLPNDESGNGGGFIFDCRALPNPGRMEAYHDKTGKDFEVSSYLEKFEEVSEFKKHVYAIVEMSIDNYLERGFTNLQINFGCTGGQHRSVYFAEELAKYIQSKYTVSVILFHREQQIKTAGL